jgi:autotransporter adhesin
MVRWRSANSATGTGSVAAGANNTGQGAVTLGNANAATGQGSIALGNASTVSVAGGIALGDTASTAMSNGVAIGVGATAGAQAGDVALGAGSAVVNTPSATINGTLYTFAGTNATSTVSVGGAGTVRTITNVAAGRIGPTSTDSINGSQLFATDQAIDQVGSQVTNLGNTIASGLGGGTTYNSNTGAITTNLTFNSTTYASVQGALTRPLTMAEWGRFSTRTPARLPRRMVACHPRT